MTLLQTASALRTRAPWAVASRILNLLGLPRAQGWEKTLARLSEIPPAEGEGAEDLQAALLEHYVGGEKQCVFYQMPENEVTVLGQGLQQAVRPQNVLAQTFPFIPSADALHVAPRRPTLTQVLEFERGKAFVFTSVRELSVREEISRDDLPPIVSEELGAYDEIVVVRHILHPAADVVWVPNDGQVVELRIDAPNGAQQEIVDAATARLLNALNEITDLFRDRDPINLFPAISAIYGDQNEGTVVELAFSTTTASLKHEKMRQRRVCLRRELYHRAGMTAIDNDISPYKLSVVWRRQRGANISSLPELSLFSNARVAGSEQPRLQRAAIMDCSDLADYDFVRDRLLAHVILP